LLLHFQGVIDLNAQVSKSALKLYMTEQQLNRPAISGGKIEFVGH